MDDEDVFLFIQKIMEKLDGIEILIGVATSVARVLDGGKDISYFYNNYFNL